MISIRDERNCLFVRLVADEVECQWWLFTHNGMLQSHGEEALASLLTNHKADRPRLCVILPASSTGLLSIDCSAKVQRKLESALPYLVEERLIENIENQQVVPLRTEKSIVAGVINCSALDSYLRPIKGLGWETESAIPEHWLWLKQQSSSALHLEGQRAWYTPDGKQAACMPVTLLADWLAIMNAASLSASIVVSSSNEAICPDFLRRLPNAIAEQLQWQTDPGWQKLLAAEVGDVSNGLLQGDYAPTVDWRAAFQRWKALVAVTMLLLAGHSTVLGWQQWQLNRGLQQADQQFLSLLQAIKPDSRAVNPQVQLNQMVAELEQRPENQFMPLFYGLAERIRVLPDVTLIDVQYSGQDGRLQANVRVLDMPTLEKLLENNGDNIEIMLNSSVRHAGGLRASLKVTAL